MKGEGERLNAAHGRFGPGRVDKKGMECVSREKK
jgi:hypothetical protein